MFEYLIVDSSSGSHIPKNAFVGFVLQSKELLTTLSSITYEAKLFVDLEDFYVRVICQNVLVRLFFGDNLFASAFYSQKCSYIQFFALCFKS